MRLVAAMILTTVGFAQEVPWPVHGGDPGGGKYSPLTTIDKSNVSKLEKAWEWRTGEGPLEEFKTFPGTFQNTPLMIDGVLYVSTPYNKVTALKATTGEPIWTYDPKAYEMGQVPNGTGFVHRGVAAWRDAKSGKLRIFMNSRAKLISLDAETGKPVMSFGDNGVADLTRGLLWETNPKHYTNTSPPVVYKDLVILGNGVADRLVYKNDPPGDVRAFDARTGKIVWTFHTIPQKGEFGNDTWSKDSWKYTGHTNVWPPFTLDAERGLVYLPVGTPSNDFYGGRRPGANLFAEALVCLDANTGKRKWHYQIIHHGLWDYDLPSPPILATIHPDGRRVDAVIQLTKQGWAFVFDRVTGKPVWPIEERAVPKSGVPGEEAWPTQPFPTKPPAFAPQGVTLDDAFDLTPELKAEARAQMQKYGLGPIFTPPSETGILMRPGIVGGANWGGGAFDPETGRLFVKSTNQAALIRVRKPPTATPEVDAEYVREGPTAAEFRNGLPLLKPPYGHLTALDLNKGTIAWQVPFGDNEALRKHPALQGATLPEKLGATGNAGAIVTKSGIVFVGGGDTSLHAVDAATGADLWSAKVGGAVTGTPMTYRTTEGRQFVVAAVGGGRTDAALVAFSLPRRP